MDVDTPAGEDEGRGGEGESEDDGDGIGGIKREGGRFVSRLSGINNKLLNGVNGDSKFLSLLSRMLASLLIDPFFW